MHAAEYHWVFACTGVTHAPPRSSLPHVRDLDSVFVRLARSSFRQRFRLGSVEARYLADKGLAEVLVHAERFIRERLAPAAPRNDGRQTPFRGHPVFVAQHATACCCRACLEKWHGIARGHALEPEEEAHVKAAIERWLRAQERGGAPEDGS